MTARTPAEVTLDETSALEQIDRGALDTYILANARYGEASKPYTMYRLRVTWVQVVLAPIRFVYLLGIARFGVSFRLYGLVGPVVCWLALMAWLLAVYFGS